MGQDLPRGGAGITGPVGGFVRISIFGRHVYSKVTGCADYEGKDARIRMVARREEQADFRNNLVIGLSVSRMIRRMPSRCSRRGCESGHEVGVCKVGMG